MAQQAIELYSKRLTEETTALVKTFPDLSVRLQQLIDANFPTRQPSVLTKLFAEQIAGSWDVNANLQAIEILVSDQVQQMVDHLMKLSQWIQMQVPKVADGNNFGVEVQKLAFLHVTESQRKWQTLWDSLPEYYNQRATAIEKFKDKIAREKSTSTTVTNSSGGKEGDEKKTVTTMLEKESTTASTPVNDWVAHVVALDVKWYFNLLRAMEGLRDQYATTFDTLEKNKDKITLPRGQGHSGMGMF